MVTSSSYEGVLGAIFQRQETVAGHRAKVAGEQPALANRLVAARQWRVNGFPQLGLVEQRIFHACALAMLFQQIIECLNRQGV